MTTDRTLVACTFYLRTPRVARVPSQPQHFYAPISIAGPWGDGRLHTHHLPALGDHIHLWANVGYAQEPTGGTYVVRARHWLHASWGSHDWPMGELVAPPATMDIIVDLATGPFHDEAPSEDDEVA